ncbi:hypothetical protein NC651_006957 [Populus alba x Populus x berolinensis]|nr:hypothetical protein NC651_006957 [Populus alba x Populus x berolinensis]
MSRLSYAKVLIELNMLTDFPNSINITLSNEVPLLQLVVYETLSKFCKHYRLLRRMLCSKASFTNAEKIIQPNSRRAKRGSVHTKLVPHATPTVVASNKGNWNMPHGEQLHDPMQIELVVKVVTDRGDIPCARNNTSASIGNKKGGQESVTPM